MAKKATVNVSKNSLEQVRMRLGSMALTLEQDLDSLANLLTLVNYNWQSENTKDFTNAYNSDVEAIKNDQKQLVENIRSFLERVKVQYLTAEKKLNSNAERLKIAKEKLHLPEKLNLKFSEKGLSYHEMRAILILPK